MRFRGVLVVALVLVMASVAANAGSQTFVNDTGEAATGIMITFSTQALITWNDGKLPDQTPDGMSDSFTFSGGSIEPGAGLMISWGPDSASVVDYHWLTKEEPSETPPENSPAVENNLPGPDEPLYQPQADEQVWLTDAEGHAVIYDNDSIKLNFAPGFDQSQIERIVWYRNGIRMRFVNPEDKVQVLTNALMKTFDGNPLEHSPASAHTDHAIAGYDYKVEIHLKDDGLKILQTTVESTFKWHPKEVWAQISSPWMYYLNHEPNASYSKVVPFFKTLREDGFTGISFIVPYYMDTPYENTVKELHEPNKTILAYNVFTPSTNDIGTILRAASEAGLDSQMMVMLYINGNYIRSHQNENIDKWMINPEDPELFFENYTKALGAVIPVLNKYHVQSITVLDETDKLDMKHAALIARMLTNLSQKFTGTLSVDISGFSMLQGWWEGKSFKELANTMIFLGWVSPDGKPLRIGYSCWAFPMESQKDQRESEIHANFIQFWKPAFNYIKTRYPDHPQAWGEVGAWNIDGYVLGPDYYNDLPAYRRNRDEQERADIMSGMLKASQELDVASLNIWKFDLGDFWPVGNNDFLLNTGFQSPTVPAYRVIKAIISSN